MPSAQRPTRTRQISRAASSAAREHAGGPRVLGVRSGGRRGALEDVRRKARRVEDVREHLEARGVALRDDVEQRAPVDAGTRGAARVDLCGPGGELAVEHLAVGGRRMREAVVQARDARARARARPGARAASYSVTRRV